MPDETSILTQTAQSAAPACGAENWARPLLERQLWVLGELAEGGLEIARAIERQAAGDDRPAQKVVDGDIALAYARVARAVRMTILLQSRLIQELQTLEKVTADAAFRTQVREDSARLRLEGDRKAQVQRIVGRIAQAEHNHADKVERLVEDAVERLDEDDIYGDVLARPVSEIISCICKDLGLNPDWPSLAEEAWAQAEIESGAAGAPLAALKGRSVDTGRLAVAAESIRFAPHAASP